MRFGIAEVLTIKDNTVSGPENLKDVARIVAMAEASLADTSVTPSWMNSLDPYNELRFRDLLRGCAAFGAPGSSTYMASAVCGPANAARDAALLAAITAATGTIPTRRLNPAGLAKLDARVLRGFINGKDGCDAAIIERTCGIAAANEAGIRLLIVDQNKVGRSQPLPGLEYGCAWNASPNIVFTTLGEIHAALQWVDGWAGDWAEVCVDRRTATAWTLTGNPAMPTELEYSGIASDWYISGIANWTVSKTEEAGLVNAMIGQRPGRPPSTEFLPIAWASLASTCRRADGHCPEPGAIAAAIMALSGAGSEQGLAAALRGSRVPLRLAPDHASQRLVEAALGCLSGRYGTA